MCRACLIARVAALAVGCAVGAPVAIATALASTDTRAATVSDPTVRTPAGERATVIAGGTAAVVATSTAQGFVGIATELTTIPTLSGPAADPDIPFINLLSNLSPGAPFLLRLGGVSADDSWWPIPGMTQPRWIHTLTPRWGADVQALLKALGGKTILGVTLKDDPRINSKIAGAEVAGFDRYVGASLIDDFELGNEPEFYPLSVVNGQRGVDTIADYDRKFSHVASALGRAPLAGPGWDHHTGCPSLARCCAICPRA